MKNSTTWKPILALGTLVLLGSLVGCSSKSSPTAPVAGGGGVPPSGGLGPGSWNITVTANPSSVSLDTTVTETPTSNITITVRNASSGAPPPNGTTLQVSASGGTLSGAGCATGASTVCTPQLLDGQTSLLFTATVPGTAVITAQLEQSVGRASISVVGSLEPTPFVLNNVSPNSGDPSGGYRATIFGQGFEAPINVLFGASNAQVVSVSPTRAVVIVPPLTTPLPAGATAPVNVTVTNAIGTLHSSTATLTNGFIYANGGSIETPVIFTVTPTTGPQEGNTPIVISGSHFDQDSQVIFRLNSSIDLEAPTNFAGSNRLESLTPDIRPYIAAGTLSSPVNAQIRVVNPNGAVAIFGGLFTYGSTIRITAIGPGSGPFTGNTRVTIFGSGFDEPVAVTLGGIAQQVVAVSGTEIIFLTSALTGSAIPPCGGQTSAAVQVTNIEGGASATGGTFTFTGPPNPIIFGVNPNSGNIGSNVTISGQNFDPSALRVLFGGADGSSAQIVSASTTSITAKVPTPPPSFAFTTQACDANDDGVASGTRNLPTAISITVRNLVTGCETTLSNAFTVNPPDNSCTGDTSEPPVVPAQCSDTFDNDTDGFIDAADPQCTGPTDNSEAA